MRERKLLDLTLLYTGCYWLATWLVMSVIIWLSGLIVNTDFLTIFLFWIGMSAFVLIGWLYFVKLAAEMKKEFFKTLEEKGKAEAKIECPELKVFQVPKATGKCPNHHKDNAAMEFTITFFYLCKESITIYTNCAKFHIFKIDRKKDPKSLIIPKYKNKEECGDILEYYYYYIQRVEFSKDNIIFHFIDGESQNFPVAKKHAKPIIKEIRNHLRKTCERKMLHGYRDPFDVRVHKPIKQKSE